MYGTGRTKTRLVEITNRTHVCLSPLTAQQRAYLFCGQITALEDSLAKRNQEIEGFTAEIQDLKRQLEDLAPLRNHSQTLQAQRDELEAKLVQAYAEIQELRKERDELKAKILQLEGSVAELVRAFMFLMDFSTDLVFRRRLPIDNQQQLRALCNDSRPWKMCSRPRLPRSSNNKVLPRISPSIPVSSFH